MSTPYRASFPWSAEQVKTTLRELGREPIVETAVLLADSGGIDEVSIRKIAGLLGVGPMRLYTHVPTKADLLALLVERVYGEMAEDLVAPRATTGPWRERVHEVGRAFRRAAFRHDWFVDLLTGRPALGPNALAVLEALAAAVEAAPGPHTAGSIRVSLSVLNAFFIGATRTDVLERRSGGDDEQWQADAAAHLRTVFVSGRYPTLEHLAFEAVMPTADDEFERGLDIVLDGIDSAAARSSG